MDRKRPHYLSYLYLAHAQPCLTLLFFRTDNV